MKKNYFIGILIVFFSITYAYTFDIKPDVNGDNGLYYIFSTSLVKGHGLVDVSQPLMKPSNVFPPGYPLLMAPVRLLTDSVIAQKLLNGLFLLLSVLGLFHILSKILKNTNLAFLLSMLGFLNYRVLDFASMMMSETSFLFFSVITLFFALKTDRIELKVKPWWKDKNFYWLILVSGFSFQIRTQGISLIVAVFVFFLFQKKWLQSVGYLIGFYLTTLPWSLRNHLAGIGGNRYLEQVMAVNQWRPEEGLLTIGAVIHRGFGTLQMLLTKAIPESIIPYLKVDYAAKTTAGEWMVGIVLVVLIIYGLSHFKHLFPLLVSYIVFTIGVICSWSAPSQNRYITTILPFLEIGMVSGIFFLLVAVLRKAGVKKTFNVFWLLPLLAIMIFPQLKKQHEEASMSYSPAYANYFSIGKQIKNKVPKNSVICSRKPQLFYLFSHTFGCNYTYSTDPDVVIKGMIKSKVDYVVLEQLGFSSTPMYLYPAIIKYQELFKPIMILKNPDTYLLQFDRQKALQTIQNGSINK